jgi:hypothetical protein
MMINFDPSRARIASFCISSLLTLPGLFIGYLGITDMAPSSPRGFAALAEIFGFGFWAWAIFSSTRLLIERFLEDVFEQIGSLFAASRSPTAFIC